MSAVAIAHITYVLPRELKEQTQSEQNRELALMALDHAVGLSKLLQCVSCDIDASPDEAQRRVDNLVNGVRAAGALLEVVCDSAFLKIGEDDSASSKQSCNQNHTAEDQNRICS